jgi:hypothetical protein
MTSFFPGKLDKPTHLTSNSQNPTHMNNCQNFLNLTYIPTQIEPTIPNINPLDFMTVITNSSLTEDLKKQDTSPMVFKLTALEMTELHYPQEDWLRVYNHGSQADEANTTRAGVHCKLLKVCYCWCKKNQNRMKK